MKVKDSNKAFCNICDKVVSIPHHHGRHEPITNNQKVCMGFDCIVNLQSTEKNHPLQCCNEYGEMVDPQECLANTKRHIHDWDFCTCYEPCRHSRHCVIEGCGTLEKDLQSTEKSFTLLPDLDWKCELCFSTMNAEERLSHVCPELQITDKTCNDCENTVTLEYEYCSDCAAKHSNQTFSQIPDTTLPCNVCRKPFKWENHFNVAIWNANEWEIETFWVHIECNAYTVYADHVKELGKVRVTYENGKGKFEILEGE